MKRNFIRFISFVLAAILLSCNFTALAAGAELDATADELEQVRSEQAELLGEQPPVQAEPEIVIDAPSMYITPKSTMQLSAEVTPAGEYTIEWSTQDKRVATIDSKGLVTAVSVGKSVITATIAGTDISAVYPVYVVRNKNAIYSYLENNSVASYRYSYQDDYFYTHDKKCWQSVFGYRNIFDVVAPYVEIEIDYVRVHFRYDNLDWMIQLWKGQYGYLFYGSEVGVYTRKPLEDGQDITVMTKYDKPAPENWLNMEMTLYWDEKDNGVYEYQFTRPYDTYWWCTGFKPGSLRQSEPAKELRMTTTIEMKDEEMARIFADKLIVCGFDEYQNKEDMTLDSFCIDGKNVDILWQNISEAESTVIVKATFWTLLFANMFGIMMLMALVGSGAMMGMLFIFLI